MGEGSFAFWGWGLVGRTILPPSLPLPPGLALPPCSPSLHAAWLLATGTACCTRVQRKALPIAFLAELVQFRVLRAFFLITVFSVWKLEALGERLADARS